MNLARHQTGVTLIELMIVIVIATILLALGIPSFQDALDKNRLKSAAETLKGDLQFAKSEAIKRNQNIRVDFSVSGNNWCYGITEKDDCDCNNTTLGADESCEIDGIRKVILGTEYRGIALNDITPPDFSFDHVRGTTFAESITFQSPRQKELRVVVSRMGRIRTCSPANEKNVPGYPSC